MISEFIRHLINYPATSRVIREANSQVSHTPDVAQLEEYKWCLLFVCGDEQKDHPNQRIMEGAELLNDNSFTVDLYEMWNVNQGEAFVPLVQPFASRMSEVIEKTPRLRMRGELYAVRPQHFFDMDKHKQNGKQFIRERRSVIVQMPDKLHIMKKVWYYRGSESYWNNHLDGGYSSHTVRVWENGFHHPVIKKYYDVTDEEY